MSNEIDISKEIARELTENHHCHTVILYGSRARGDFNKNSDIDVLGIRDSGDAYRIGRPWNGYLLDAWVYGEENLPTPDNLFQIANGVVLTERDDMGTKLLCEIQCKLSTPPKPLPTWELELRVTWIEKMLARAAAGDAEGDYRRHWLLYSLLEDWFAFAERHYLGPKESLKFLETSEPSLFLKFQQALRPSADLAAIRTLASAVTTRAVRP